MYYKVKFYFKKKRFSKFKFNVDSKYLSYLLNELDKDSKFIQVDKIIIDKSLISHIKFIEKERK